MITPHLRLVADAAKRLVSRFRTNQRGNVLMITGLSIVFLTFATGIGIDYSRAMRLQTKLNAAADAAALAAVTEPMMLQSNSTATSAATNMFNTEVAGLPGLLNVQMTPSVTGNDKVTSTRTAVVTYTASSTNAFGSILHWASLPIHGSSTATATAAPNIDFYLALDTSPSMALPTTTPGLTQMDTMFGCSFACHSNKIQVYAGGGSMPYGMITAGNGYSNPYKINYSLSGPYKNGSNAQSYYTIDSMGSYIYINAPVKKTIADTSTQSKCADSSGNDICVYNADGTFVDTYWYAQNQGISLRVTAERGAVGDLMTLAKSYAAQNNRAYRAALYTFDYGTSPYNNVQTIASLTSNLDSISTASSKINVVTVNDKAGNGCPPGPTSCSSNQYLFTSFNSVLTKMVSEMPATSGKGTNFAGDTPQDFLFLVTDGMSDEDINGSGRSRSPMLAAQLAQCNALKARGIKIAILYTEYTTASIQDDKASDPSQWQLATTAITTPTTIAQQLTNCASSPDLMYTVSTDQDISTALQTLFTRAVATAKLTK